MRSVEFSVSGGEYVQYEFFDDAIAVAFWGECPLSTTQWVKPSPGRYYLDGTDNNDLALIPVTHTTV